MNDLIAGHPFADTTKCWNCDTELDRSQPEQYEWDGLFGIICPNCKESIRSHPIYGEDKEQDVRKFFFNNESI